MFPRIPLLILSTVATVILPSALAASCPSSQKYIPIPQFVAPKKCVPSGYFQAQDLGNTNPQDLVSRCEAQCTSYGSRCFAYVGQLWKAADSNLYSGQCYYYSTTPPPPVSCADNPTILLAEQKDTIASCFVSSASAATAYCSSILSAGTVTVYTKTITPTTTTQTSTTASTSTTSSITVTSTTSTTATIVSSTSTTSTVSQFTTSTTTTSTTTTITSTTSTTTITYVPTGAGPGKRALTSPLPSCVPTFEPSASLTSACSCLSITTSTVYLVSTAPTVTQMLISSTSTTSTILQTSTTTSTVRSSTTTTTTYLTTTTTTSSTFSTLTVSSTSQSNVLATHTACPVGNVGVGSISGNFKINNAASFQTSDIDECCIRCYTSDFGCAYFIKNGNDCFLYTGNNAPNPDSQCPNGHASGLFQSGGTSYFAGDGPCGTMTLY